MSPIQKIKLAMAAKEVALSQQEQSVIDMMAHLEAIHINAMPELEGRRAALATVPPGILQAVKDELMQLFAMKAKPTGG